MKKILLTTAIIAGLAASTSASASSEGAYMGIQGGYSWSKLDPSSQKDFATSGGLQKKKTDRNGVSADIHFGYLFPITDSFSMGPEVGIGKNFYKPKYKTYVSDDKGHNAGFQTKVDTKLYVPIFLRAQLQLNDQLYVFGKAGIAYMDQKATISKYGNLSGAKVKADLRDESNKRWVGAYGVGMGYNIDQNLDLEISYNYLDGDGGKERKGHAFRTLKSQNVSLGVNYTF